MSALGAPARFRRGLGIDLKARPLSGDANSRRGARVCVVEVEAAVTPEAATSVLSCSLVCTMASSS
jgi:hypothetical protein